MTEKNKETIALMSAALISVYLGRKLFKRIIPGGNIGIAIVGKYVIYPIAKIIVDKISKNHLNLWAKIHGK